ncbi:serine/threonine-protein kinase [Streptomyces sp. MI02-7b]|uniref:serine/threonine-protein kinase n=1 Tax=Streptomyces sp. MI02-7b TaxID=462941 RepID=UPI0029B8E222|nr:serine/threonine-protein kinase [Streptomyces sp. MI02-7b]MDX3071688.1 serine/threonine-protein kinase [Streptomyces sp. MI02-7b]
MQPLQANDPTAIGPYRLLGRLGAGGMGRVYLGRSPGGRTVAVKVVRSELADDLEFRTRFQREVEAARRVGGAWSAPVLDADTDSPVPWVATRYVAGPALSDAVKTFGPLPEDGVRALGAGLAEALEEVHGRGLVHRDIKPSNVLLSLDGPVLIDFGIARAMDATAALTSKGVVVGSPGYMAPEQVTGRPTGPAADVFALGAVIVFAATGQGPFPGDSAAVLLYKVAHEEPEFEGMPAGLRGVAESCLAKDPAARPTPRQLAGLLAPDGGAASLVHGGWLPAALTERLGRQAVELLDLEPTPPPGALGGVAGTDSGTAGTGSSYGSHPSYGTFGPPPRLTEPHDAVPSSFAATPPPVTTPAVPRRGRAASLAGAGVVLVAAAVTLGLVLHDGGRADDQGKGGGSPATSRSTASVSAPASPSHGSATPSAPRLASLPAAFAGTWKGDTVTAHGVPGTFEITITPGKVGAVVGHDKSVLSLLGQTYDCSGQWKLATATERWIVLDTSGGTNPHPGVCSDGSADERFTLDDDGSLHYRSGDSLAGNPEGDLRKQGG